MSKSQWMDVVNHLRKHGSITSQEAFKHYGITRLSGIIFKLKKLDFVIVAEKCTTKNRHGNICNYAKYVLKKDSEEVWKW